MNRYQDVVSKFEQYMDASRNKPKQQIAYFSMEYGLHESIKIYSGGLGVLAGDFLKQASDDNINIVGVGLLYRFGYFSQNLSASGEQLATYAPHNFPNMSAQPVRNEKGQWKKVIIAFPGRTLHARIWKIDVGRIPLYLLDTDIPDNAPNDRFITHQLYGGDWENRFKQEFLLGIGGIRLLDALGIQPDVYHCNEGHAAFTGLERVRKYILDEKLSFQEAIEVVRASSLFTTHTPVPAGHDFFSEDMLRTYMPHYADRLGISWENFMALGKMNPKNPEESFSMSVLAVKLSQQVNGVSRIHGAVSRDMFKDLYPGYFPEEIHIGHVTNGVHYGTWTSKRWQQLYKTTFGEDFLNNISDPKHWQKIYEVDDQVIWDIRSKERKKLFSFIKKECFQISRADRKHQERSIKPWMLSIKTLSLLVLPGASQHTSGHTCYSMTWKDFQRSLIIRICPFRSSTPARPILPTMPDKS
jgi:glycogen phosphorylase/synthase